MPLLACDVYNTGPGVVVRETDGTVARVLPLNLTDQMVQLLAVQLRGNVGRCCVAEVQTEARPC